SSRARFVQRCQRPHLRRQRARPLRAGGVGGAAGRARFRLGCPRRDRATAGGAAARDDAGDAGRADERPADVAGVRGADARADVAGCEAAAVAVGDVVVDVVGGVVRDGAHYGVRPSAARVLLSAQRPGSLVATRPRLTREDTRMVTTALRRDPSTTTTTT